MSILRLFSELGDWTAAVSGDQVTLDGTGGAFVVKAGSDSGLTVDAPEGALHVSTAALGDSIWIGVDGYALEFQIDRSAGRVRSAARDVDYDALTPPMSATVVRIQVKPGDHVDTGDTLIVLEAMKMELPIRAPRKATVRAIHCAEGQLVQPGMILIDIE